MEAERDVVVADSGRSLHIYHGFDAHGIRENDVATLQVICRAVEGDITLGDAHAAEYAWPRSGAYPTPNF